MEPRLRFVITREVQAPRRAGKDEAGIDFFVPTNLTYTDILKANEKVEDIKIYDSNGDWPSANTVLINHNKHFVTQIVLGSSSRIIIPSGVRALIEPNNSALIAANKSGISTKKGLVYGAEVVDSTYTGEIHINVINTSDVPQFIEAGEKLIQFIHTPILLTEIEYIDWDNFQNLSDNWSERGDNWQGSSNVIDIKPYDDKPNS